VVGSEEVFHKGAVLEVDDGSLLVELGHVDVLS
jgi:hypothetical protein